MCCLYLDLHWHTYTVYPNNMGKNSFLFLFPSSSPQLCENVSRLLGFSVQDC